MREGCNGTRGEWGAQEVEGEDGRQTNGSAGPFLQARNGPARKVRSRAGGSASKLILNPNEQVRVRFEVAMAWGGCSSAMPAAHLRCGGRGGRVRCPGGHSVKHLGVGPGQVGRRELQARGAVDLLGKVETVGLDVGAQTE